MFSIFYELTVSKAGSTTQSTDNVGTNGKRNLVKKQPVKKTVTKTNNSDKKKEENKTDPGIPIQNPNVKPIHRPHEHPTMAKAQKVWKDPLNKSLPAVVLKKVNNLENEQANQDKTVRIVGTKGIDPNKNTNNGSNRSNQSNQRYIGQRPTVDNTPPAKPIKTFGPA